MRSSRTRPFSWGSTRRADRTTTSLPSKGRPRTREVVRFYGDAQCSDQIPLGDDRFLEGEVVDGEFSAPVDVADNTGIVVFAAAARGGPESDCSNGITYIELTPPPPTVVTRTVVKTRVVTRKVIVEAPLPEPLAGATLVSPTNGGRILGAPVFEWQTPSAKKPARSSSATLSAGSCSTGSRALGRPRGLPRRRSRRDRTGGQSKLGRRGVSGCTRQPPPRSARSPSPSRSASTARQPPAGGHSHHRHRLVGQRPPGDDQSQDL